MVIKFILDLQYKREEPEINLFKLESQKKPQEVFDFNRSTMYDINQSVNYMKMLQNPEI